jgi:hypothetical protein
VLISAPEFNGVRVTRSLVLCVCFVDRCLSFFLAIVLFVLLRFTDSDDPFGIFKHFLLFMEITHFRVSVSDTALKTDITVQ